MVLSYKKNEQKITAQGEGGVLWFSGIFGTCVCITGLGTVRTK
jgi:hypothetical protein